MFRKISAVFLCLVICIVPLSLRANAVTYPAFAVVSHNTGPIYSQPGFIDSKGHDGRLDKTKPSTVITTLSKDDRIKVLGDIKDGDGDLWYHIGYGNGYANEGYIYSTRITFVANYVEDPEFEAWLTEQGFPESYKVGLRDLHSLYPNWVFYADHTGLEWETAVSAESALGKKLVHSSKDNSWKSMVENAYNWESGTWKGFDGTSWVAASKRVVAFYLDPRSYFDTTNIFVFAGHSYNADYDNLETLKTFVKGTFMDSNVPDETDKTYADIIMEAANYSGLSPYVIASNIRQEQGTNGIGGSISGNITGYTGLYNFFNIGAYATSTMNAVQRGLWWANGEGYGATTYNRPWTSRAKSIKGGAEWFEDNYTAIGQNTFYYMNFNVIGTRHELYTHQYATNIEDTLGKGSQLVDAYAQHHDAAIVFHIPVYKNMPESTTLPTNGTSNNCYLSALTVTGYEDELETFYYYKCGYELIVSGDTDIITVNAVASDSNATVTGAGKHELQAGNNEIKITVTSTSGLQQVYTLTVFREGNGTPSPEPEPEPPVVIPEPEITGGYTVGTYATGIQPETSVSSFITNLAVRNGTARVFDASGGEKTTGNIATGDRVRVYDNGNEIKKECTVVVYGDINCDGRISVGDLASVKMHLLEVEKLSDIKAVASDINRDSRISIGDLAAVKMHLLNVEAIKQ